MTSKLSQLLAVAETASRNRKNYPGGGENQSHRQKVKKTGSRKKEERK
jgi:hypothetical protein